LLHLVAKTDQADMVLGYLPHRPAPISAKLLSYVERTVLRALFGFFPRFQGVLMVKTDLLAQIELKTVGRGWAVVMELILKAHRQGYRHVGCATEMQPRLAGESKVRNVRAIASNVRQLLALRWSMRRSLTH
jgi:hypothetical protein